MILICKLKRDGIQRMPQQDDYGPFGEKKQFYLHLSRQLRNGGHQSTPPSLGKHNRLNDKLKSTLDCNGNGCLLFPPFPLCRTFGTTTRAGHLQCGNGLGQTLYLSDFDNLGDPNTLLTRGLSNNRKLDTSHTKSSLRRVLSILPANHNDIIGHFQIIYDSNISLR